ncbi:MAG: methylmalonyl-CoA epimerase [Acidimicrobiales bacterium]
MPLLTLIDHVAVAVRDLEAAIAWYRSAFGAVVAHRERVEHDGVDEALLSVAESFVQLLTPTRPDSPVARFLDRRGEGLHHVAYRVDDCAEALAAAAAAGARLVDLVPRPGSRGTRVAFVHPASAFGTLVELVEVVGGSAQGEAGGVAGRGQPVDGDLPGPHQ